MKGKIVRISLLPLLMLPASALTAALPDGFYPILSVPYHDDGALDCETLVAEARFTVEKGVKGFIWAQSNDAIDLLSVEERKKSFEALAREFSGGGATAVFGCQGRDIADMEALARCVEALARKYPSAAFAIASRPPHDARTQDDIYAYYRRLAEIAKRPVIIQTYTSEKVPIPAVPVLIRLAKEFPEVYGWVKEETGGEDANERMLALSSAPEIKSVFSAWGSYGWLDQHRRFGTRGLVSERAGYADFLVKVWKALERGDRRRADRIFSAYLFMMNLKETVPGGHLRGFNLHILRKRGIFKNLVSREYVEKGDVSGRWKLSRRVFSEDEIREMDERYSLLEEAAR